MPQTIDKARSDLVSVISDILTDDLLNDWALSMYCNLNFFFCETALLKPDFKKEIEACPTLTTLIIIGAI